jgi:O6-methylguanine-DNA--protein-cysteine methyltransferase
MTVWLRSCRRTTIHGGRAWAVAEDPSNRLRAEAERQLPLTFAGTPFQFSVWRALLSIPYGETRSYDDIARQIGHPAAMRAVGAPIAATRSRSWRRVIA